MSLSRYLGKGVRGELVYQTRQSCPDTGNADDVVSLSFDPGKMPLSIVLSEVFPQYLSAFDAYTGHVGDEEFLHRDFDAKQGRFDPRKAVFRLYQACYFDQTLCRRAFDLPPEEVARKVEPIALQVVLDVNGVRLIFSDRVLALDEAEAINREAHERLA